VSTHHQHADTHHQHADTHHQHVDTYHHQHLSHGVFFLGGYLQSEKRIVCGEHCFPRLQSLYLTVWYALLQCPQRVVKTLVSGTVYFKSSASPCHVAYLYVSHTNQIRRQPRHSRRPQGGLVFNWTKMFERIEVSLSIIP
jgi:hypothetical protein